MTVKMRHSRLYASAIDVEVRAAVIQTQGLFNIQGALRYVCFILRQDRDVILPGRFLTECNALDFVALWYLPVELHPHEAPFREFQAVSNTSDVPFYPICRICLSRELFAAELCDPIRFVPYEILDGGWGLYLRLAQG